MKDLKNIEKTLSLDFDFTKKIELKKSELNFYKNHKFFKSLKMSDQEVKKNLFFLDQVIKENEACKKIKDHCINNSNYHLDVCRIDKEIYFFASPCKKMLEKNSKELYKNNFLYNYYSSSNYSDIRLNAESFANSLTGSGIFKSKLDLINFFKNDLSSDVNKSCYVYGKQGVGKTFTCLAFANEVAEKLNKKICVVYFPEFVNILKSGFNNLADKDNANKIFDSMKNADLLFIDDLGAEYATEWFYSNYFLSLLNYRVAQNKPIIFNSNFNILYLEKSLSNKIKSKDKNDIVARIIDRIKVLVKDNVFNLKGTNMRVVGNNND